MGKWTRNTQTQADVEASILDWWYDSLPRPLYTGAETETLANRVYEYVWQQSEISSRNDAGVGNQSSRAISA